MAAPIYAEPIFRPGAESQPGSFAFTTLASAFVRMRDPSSPGSIGALKVAVFVTRDCHVLFGGQSMPAPDVTSPPLVYDMGWQVFRMNPADDGLRVIGDSPGAIYWFWTS